MITNSPATTILPVADSDRAVAFYRDRLGLTHQGRSGDGKDLFRLGSDGVLALIEKPPGAQAEHTVLSFQVDDIGSAIRDLESRGVAFDDYDLPGLTTVDHVCVLGSEKAAWFRDTEGNILCLHEVIAES